MQTATFVRLFYKYRTYSMIGRSTFIENLAIAATALKALPGAAVIECGTWKGGMAAALVEIGGPARAYHFFDSFAGLPAAEAIDGAAAQAWQADTTSPVYFDNCRASVGDIKSALTLTGSSAAVGIHPGFFEHTLPTFDPPKIACLRLDADWYSSTMICLEKFWDHVLPGGVILIDDYHVWDGCSRAVHEFLARRQAVERIQQGRRAGVAFITKRELSEPRPLSGQATGTESFATYELSFPADQGLIFHQKNGQG